MNDAATQFQPAPLYPEAPPPAQSAPTPPAAAATRPRVWPGVVVVALMWAAVVGPGLIPELQGTRWQVNGMLFGAMGGAALVGLWWLFASRTPWADRLLLLLFFGVSGLAVFAVAHPSFVYMGYGPIVRGLPLASTALVAWLLLTPGLHWPTRRLGAAVAILLAWGYCCALRFDGVWGDFQAQVSWRWTPTAEDAYAASRHHKDAAEAVVAAEKALELRAGDWPSFRGPDRDSRLAGVRIATDWTRNPPRKLWGKEVGPGWSSFAVVGDRIYTQEQLDKNSEAVVCYDANTGEERWSHTDPGRFEEVAGGVGPRSTPTFAKGRLYALGANGRLNCLDPVTGKVKWTRDIVSDSGAAVPRWGFSSSPLIVGDVVAVFAGGPDGKSVLAYKADSGDVAWKAGEGKDSYCSPHLERLNGVEQVVIATDKGLTAFDPNKPDKEGKVLWQHEWSMGQQGARVAQPVPVGDSDVLVGTPMLGARRVHLTREGDKWTDQVVWQSKDIRPYYNDLVIYKDHAYGFDNNLFTCVSLADGKGKWRARGYGNGQVILLADQGLLLISTEKGEVALVEANPERHKELGRFLALERRGKTWNHPVVAHGKLFIRNCEEMACFQLAEEGGTNTAAK
jgi:outer membrane protein assembly factor BamB